MALALVVVVGFCCGNESPEVKWRERERKRSSFVFVYRQSKLNKTKPIFVSPTSSCFAQIFGWLAGSLIQEEEESLEKKLDFLVNHTH